MVALIFWKLRLGGLVFLQALNIFSSLQWSSPANIVSSQRLQLLSNKGQMSLQLYQVLVVCLALKQRVVTRLRHSRSCSPPSFPHQQMWNILFIYYFYIFTAIFSSTDARNVAREYVWALSATQLASQGRAEIVVPASSSAKSPDLRLQ